MFFQFHTYLPLLIIPSPVNATTTERAQINNMRIKFIIQWGNNQVTGFEIAMRKYELE
jgi:hypothetical protein